MADQRKSPRLLGTVVVVALFGAVAVAAYSGAFSLDSAPSDDGALNAPSAAIKPSSGAESAENIANSDSTAADIPADAFAATVNYVHDGDTLYLDDGSTERKVRLIGIDTPELNSAQRPDAGECYGEEARQLLRDFLPEGTQVWASEDREPEDRYGRALLYVYLDDGTLVNLAMIELGAAEALKVGLNDRHWSALRAAEEEAFAAQLGMWGRC